MTDPKREPTVRALITAGTNLAVRQLARDLSNDAALHVEIAATVGHLWQQIEATRPNVVLLDTRLAGEKTVQLVMDLVHKTRLPVLVRTEITDASNQSMLDCIDAGALAILTKPPTTDLTTQAIPSLLWNLKAAAAMTAQPSTEWSIGPETPSASVLAIGAAMGGALTLARILAHLPAHCPATVAITPLPARLIGPWVDRLNRLGRTKVKLAQTGEILQPGHVLIAPGDGHLILRRTSSDWAVQLKDGPAVFYQKPSLEILFNSIADTPAPNAVGVLLSGAGVDGIAGLLRLRKSGGRTLTETPSTSLFPDLPTKALQCHAAETSAPANQLPTKILELAATQAIPRAA